MEKGGNSSIFSGGWVRMHVANWAEALKVEYFDGSLKGETPIL